MCVLACLHTFSRFLFPCVGKATTVLWIKWLPLGSWCHEDRKLRWARLDVMREKQESVVIHKQAGIHILSTYYGFAHTHIHTLTSTPYCKCHLYFCLCQAFSLTKHTHRHTATERKRLVLLPNKLMCHGFLSDISEKKKNSGRRLQHLSFSSSSSPPVTVWDEAVAVTVVLLL